MSRRDRLDNWEVHSRALTDMPSRIAEEVVAAEDDDEEWKDDCLHSLFTMRGNAVVCMRCGRSTKYIKALSEARKQVAAWAEEAKQRGE